MVYGTNLEVEPRHPSPDLAQVFLFLPSFLCKEQEWREDIQIISVHSPAAEIFTFRSETDSSDQERGKQSKPAEIKTGDKR